MLLFESLGAPLRCVAVTAVARFTSCDAARRPDGLRAGSLDEHGCRSGARLVFLSLRRACALRWCLCGPPWSPICRSRVLFLFHRLHELLVLLVLLVSFH